MGEKNYCIELSPEAQQNFRTYAKKHGLYQYEVLVSVNKLFVNRQQPKAK
jgi:hypothetical protein